MDHTSYHFDVGNSTTGPIGFCARICAPTADVALAKLQQLMPIDLTASITFSKLGPFDIDDSDQQLSQRPAQIPNQYFAIYTNPDAISVDDIDEEELCSCGALDDDGFTAHV
ncbi:MAG: hypothetical protein ACYDHD_00125 [Vulcanimicrobiaceae bacterium]